MFVSTAHELVSDPSGFGSGPRRLWIRPTPRGERLGLSSIANYHLAVTSEQALRALLAGSVAAAPQPVSAAAGVLLQLLDDQSTALAEITALLERMERKIDELRSAPLREGLHHIRDTQNASTERHQRAAAEKARDAFVVAASQGHPIQRFVASAGCAFCWAAEAETDAARRWTAEAETQFALAVESAAVEVRAADRAPIPFRKRLRQDQFINEQRERRNSLCSAFDTALSPLGKTLDELDGGRTYVDVYSGFVEASRNVRLTSLLVLPTATLRAVSAVRHDYPGESVIDAEVAIEIVQRRSDSSIEVSLEPGPAHAGDTAITGNGTFSAVTKSLAPGLTTNVLRGSLAESAVNYLRVSHQPSSSFGYHVGAALPWWSTSRFYGGQDPLSR